jgi:hypothetical protein
VTLCWGGEPEIGRDNTIIFFLLQRCGVYIYKVTLVHYPTCGAKP